MSIRIQHVSIPISPDGHAAARTFYGEFFGLKEIPVPPSLSAYPIIWYRMGDTELHLFSEEPRTDTSGRHFCFALDSVAEMASLRQRLIDGGIQVSDAVEIPSRPRYFCRDPFNNLIEFTTIEYDYLKA